MKRFSTVQRYSAGGVLLAVFFLIGISIFILSAGSPENETVIEANYPEPVEETIDPRKRKESQARQQANGLGLDAQMVIGLIRSETLLKRAEDFEGACSLETDQSVCIGRLSDKLKEMKDTLGRKPTPGEMLFAHTFNVGHAVAIAQMPGHFLVKDMDEKILKANDIFLRRETIQQLRIWVSRSVYRSMR